MKHYFLLFVLVSTCSITVSSQALYQMQLTQDMDKKVANNLKIESIGQDNIFFTREDKPDKKKSILLFKLDSQMKIVDSLILGEKLKNLGENSANFEENGVDQVVSFNTNQFLITAQKDTRKKAIKLFSKSISSDLKLGEEKPLLELENVDYNSIEKSKGDLSHSCFKREVLSPSFGRFHYSPDKKKAMYLCDLTEEEKMNPEKLHIAVFSEDNFSKIWAKEIKIEHPARLLMIEKFAMNNQGDVAISCLKFINKLDVEIDNMPNYKYVVFLITNNGENVKEFEITYNTNFLSDLDVEFDNKNDLICGALISNEGLSDVSGYLTMKISVESNSIVYSKNGNFPKELILENLSETKLKAQVKSMESGKPGLLKEFDLDEVIHRPDGGFYMVGEYFFHEEMNFSPFGSGGLMYDPYYFYSNLPYLCDFFEILVLSFNKDGEYEWGKKVPKRQKSKGEEMQYCSYGTILNENDLWLVYNDNYDKYDPENANKKDISNETFHVGGQNESALVLTHFTPNGFKSSEMIRKLKSQDGFMQPFSICVNNGIAAFFAGIDYHNFVYKLSFDK